MRQLKQVFGNARKENRVALVGYLPVGYPNPEDYSRLVATAFEEGLDVLEMGLPSQNPFLDGKVIQDANQSVVQAGLSVDAALELGGKTLQRANACGVVMVYRAEILAYGMENLVKECLRHGYSGILPVAMEGQELKDLYRYAEQYGLAVVGFIKAELEAGQIEASLNGVSGFVYFQGMSGTTGQHLNIDDAFESRANMVMEAARKKQVPVAVGFGIREPEDVRAMRRLGVDGVIIGTAMVQVAETGLSEFKAYVRSLVKAARDEE